MVKPPYKKGDCLVLNRPWFGCEVPVPVGATAIVARTSAGGDEMYLKFDPAVGAPLFWETGYFNNDDFNFDLLDAPW